MCGLKNACNQYQINVAFRILFELTNLRDQYSPVILWFCKWAFPHFVKCQLGSSAFSYEQKNNQNTIGLSFLQQRRTEAFIRNKKKLPLIFFVYRVVIIWVILIHYCVNMQIRTWSKTNVSSLVNYAHERIEWVLELYIRYDTNVKEFCRFSVQSSLYGFRLLYVLCSVMPVHADRDLSRRV